MGLALNTKKSKELAQGGPGHQNRGSLGAWRIINERYTIEEGGHVAKGKSQQCPV